MASKGVASFTAVQCGGARFSAFYQECQKSGFLNVNSPNVGN